MTDKRLHGSAALLLGLLLLGALLPGGLPAAAAQKPAGEQPYLTELNGTWEFYWNQLLRPADFRPGAQRVEPAAAVRVPAQWSSYTLEGKPLPNQGYATYRLLASLPPGSADKTLAVYMPSVATAYKLWANGAPLGGNGTVGMDKRTMVPRNEPHIYYFVPAADTVELVVQVSNFVQRKGGLWAEIRLGDAEAVSQLRTRALMSQMFIAACLLIMAFYHFGLFAYRRSDRSTLYFGGICLAICLRTVVLGETAILIWLPQLPWEWLVKTEYISIAAAVILLMHFFKSQYRLEWLPRIRQLFTLLAGAVVVVVLALPASIYTEWLLLMQLVVVLPSLLYVLIGYMLAISRKLAGSLLNSVGFALFFASMLNDILYYRQLSAAGPLIPYGLLGFLLTQSLNISGMFSRAFSEVEQLSNRLQTANESLEAKVSERTAELVQTNVSLERANGELSRMEALRRRLLTNISHEIGTPLTSIKGYVKAMLDGVIPHQDNKYTKLIYDKTLLLERLMDDLLELTKLEARQIQFQLQTTPVVPFFRQLALRNEAELRQQGQALRWLEPGRPAGDGFVALAELDAMRMEQVLLNLLSNAVKYSAAGGTVTVGLELDSGAFPDGTAVLSVTDTGEGIAEQELAYLFERFYRGEASRKKHVPGTGLGLAICREIVAGHGGELGAVSAPGRGSCFYMKLPIRFVSIEGREQLVEAYEDHGR